MESKTFDSVFDSLCVLNNTEGPSRNVFEPKFAAREQMFSLLSTLRGVARDSPSLAVQAQVCRCLVFVGGNMIETDEEKEGFDHLLRAHALIEATLTLKLVEGDVTGVKAVNLQELLTNETALLLSNEDSMQYAFEYLEVLNAICVHLANSDDTKFRLDDARKLLHRAEAVYRTWSTTSVAFRMEELNVGDDGKLIRLANVEDDTFKKMQMRHRMEGCHTTTIFLLSQVYAQKNDPALASRYCHGTLARQLLTRQEFSRKEWAKNAIMLSTYFDSIRDFGKAHYCLRAGEHMMPKEPADEETTGVVAWGFGRHYLNRLAYYADVLTGADEQVSSTSRADEWWNEFHIPSIGKAEVVPHVTSFESARDDVFKEGKKWFQLALQLYPVDGCCTDHIRIQQDLGNLFKYLVAFEPDVERRILMHQKRIEPLVKLPDELNFQSYCTLIRQLLFDLGDMHSDILDLRILQKKSDGKNGKPLSDSKLNQLSEETQKYFVRFCATYKDLKSGVVPDVLDEDSRVPYFRALMRIAHLQSKRWFKSPKDEYEGIELTIAKYEGALKFAKANSVVGCEQEVRLAQEMVQLLPGKQRDIRRTFSKSS